MSESSSDTESSCGWTIISNEGSDIETLGSENPLEYGTDAQERAPEIEPDLQNLATSLSAGCLEDGGDTHDTLEEETLDETFTASEAGTAQVTLFSSSDHSDIVTLGDTRADEHAVAEPEETVASEEDFYLGTSSSSQYTFNAVEVETVFPVQQQPVVINNSSSSSEDDTAGSSTTTVVVRRRRLRKNTVSSVTEPEEEGEGEGEEEPEERRAFFQSQERAEEEVPVRPAAQGHRVSSSTLNRCILLALVVAISMGFGHFYATFQIQERHKIEEQIRENEREDVRDVLLDSFQKRFIGKEVVEDLREDVDELDMVHTLSGLVESITTENQELTAKHSLLKAQRDYLLTQLKQSSEKTAALEYKQQKLMAESGLLKSSLEREQTSLSGLQDELRTLHSQIADLEALRGGAATTDSILLENQRLKGELEEEKMVFTSIQSQREAMAAECHTLRTKLDEERRTSEQLRAELDHLSHSRARFGEEEADSETVGELQSRLSEAETKLSFERQRSDLWERLYVETKEERAKGDTQPKVKKAKEGVIGKVKETFDAVKNSTKEFVHHHKEQIKKAKDAVKENLRKFSDSVKSTFRHFKDSASTLINKARGSDHRFNQRDAREEAWQHSLHRPHHKPSSDGPSHSGPSHSGPSHSGPSHSGPSHSGPSHSGPSHSGPSHSSPHNHNTRKSGAKVHNDRGETDHQRADPNSCSGVFECAYQESMRLFNKGMGPVRADEFHQLLQSYLQQEVDHFRHWSELEKFVNSFFRNGVFIHDQMLFTDFVSGVEDYLEDMHEYHGLDDDVFEDLDEYVYKHFFGDSSSKQYGPRRPFEGPDPGGKEEVVRKQQGCKRQRAARTRQHRDNRKWSRSGRNTDRHMVADVKIELGPMPFDPKY